VTNIRHLRRVAPPLASYFRVGHRDASLMGKLLEQGFPVGSGVIVDPSAATRTAELRGTAVESGVEVILDSRAVELSTIGGFSLSTVAKLPWAGSEPHQPSNLTGPRGLAVAKSIAQTAIDQRVTGVLAPTHLLDNVETWLDVDAGLVGDLRDSLDGSGAGTTTIYYPLVVPLRLFRDERAVARIMESLSGMISARQIDGIFLRVQGFGSTRAGSRNLRTYIAVARTLHSLGVPLVGERTGCVGVALSAFGAVGGVESSLTYGENYDARRLMKKPEGKGFVPAPRVYLPGAMLTIPIDQARSVLGRRGFRRLACQRSCCSRDRDAVFNNPRRHFVVTRASELSDMSGIPNADRPEHYMTTSLTPARDNAAQIARFDSRVAKHRDRLDDWCLALQRTLREDQASLPTTALVPTGRRLQAGA
jgi:hypothetical protein